MGLRQLADVSFERTHGFLENIITQGNLTALGELECYIRHHVLIIMDPGED